MHKDPSKHEEKDVEGYEKVHNMKRVAKRNPNPENQKKPQTSNRFETLGKILENEEGRVELEKPGTSKEPPKVTK